jgi:hypothetical protein
MRMDEEQRLLHAAAEKCVGVLAGRNPRRAETARKMIQARLRKRYGRTSLSDISGRVFPSSRSQDGLD